MSQLPAEKDCRQSSLGVIPSTLACNYAHQLGRLKHEESGSKVFVTTVIIIERMIHNGVRAVRMPAK